MTEFPFHKGGIKNPSLWKRFLCEFKHGEHYYMTPSDDIQPWCARCGKFDSSFVPVQIKVPSAPVAPQGIPILILEGIVPMMPHRAINKTIKDSIVFLVDEYRARHKILGHVSLEDAQLDELIEGITDVIYMYEGIYHLPPKGEDDIEESNV